MLELLSPAASPEAVVAAVRSGADSIYLRPGKLKERRGAPGFTDEEFSSAVRYCRVRGCKVYAELSGEFSNEALTAEIEKAHRAARLGADAIILNDLGLLRALKSILPDMPLFASEAFGADKPDAVTVAQALGFKRVFLAPETRLEEIKLIAQRAELELGVQAHGRLCFCRRGQCALDLAAPGADRTDACNQICREKFSLAAGAADYPMSLKDLCRGGQLRELQELGLSCVRLEGLLSSPEYTALATQVYSEAIRSGVPPAPESLAELEAAFSPGGFTEDFSEPFAGSPLENELDLKRLLAQTRRSYAAGETRRVPVKFFALIKNGEKSHFAVEDEDGNKVVRDGPTPFRGKDNVLSQKGLYDCFYKTGGTFYICKELESVLDEGLFLPEATLLRVKDVLLEELTKQRRVIPAPRTGMAPSKPSSILPQNTGQFIFEVTRPEQLTNELAQLKADHLYIPLEILSDAPESLAPFLESGARLTAVLPRVYSIEEQLPLLERLKAAAELGVEAALIDSLAALGAVRRAGLMVRGNFGLGARNSGTLQLLTQLGFESATGSVRLSLRELDEMAKPLNTEIIAYGRPPLGVSDYDIIGVASSRVQAELVDGMGRPFPVRSLPGGRTALFGDRKIFLADRLTALRAAGLWGLRLMFTTESPAECVRVAETYMGRSKYVPNGVTRCRY
ncbi:MAG: U32 family peptidase [Oscillospiraceae bacterium]|jgi:putative protease|nr:U32 family peptidase [Oscillospiraceae bacterium]